MHKCEFCILLVSYNPKLKQLLNTIDSVLCQKNITIQIVIADDGSKNNFYKEIELYLKKQFFYEYTFVYHKENFGTVKNIIYALPYCKGCYLKIIGAGDMLSSLDALNLVYNKFETEKCKIIFSKMENYRLDKSDKIYSIKSKIPITINKYKNPKFNYKKDIVTYSNNISGASMFFEFDTFLLLITEIDNIVLFAEDYIQYLAILKGFDIKFIDKYLIFYEYGTGISTSEKANSKIKEDHINFIKYVYDNYNSNLLDDRKRLETKSIIGKCITFPSFSYRKLKNRIYFSLNYRIFNKMR